MLKRTGLISMVLAVAAVGCSQNKPTVSTATPPPNRQDFDKIKDPTIQPDTHFAAGQLAVARGQYDVAEKQFKACLKQNPNHLGAMYGMACLHTKTKDYAAAMGDWQKYVAATGGSAMAYNDLAYCEELAGKPEIAEQDYRKGVAKDPKCESCRVNYGMMLARQDRISEATVQLQAVLTAAEVHCNLAAVYENAGRKEQARSEYEKAVQLDPQMSDAKSRLANLN
jgi:Tfp pilus assembly protein PilF